MSKIIAVCGGPDSGKTTVALKMAQEIYRERKGNTVVFLSPDLETPSLGFLFPNGKDQELHSVGKALDKTDIFKEDVMKQFVNVKTMLNFAFLGFKLGENKYTVYSTPDTQYERSAPSGFTVPVTPSDNTQYGTWWEYVYTGGKFVKKEYCVTAPSTKASIQAATGETDYVTQSGQIVMKSGYGISIGAGLSVVNASGYDTATSAMFTQPQFVTATFPEFEFRQAANKCRTLQKTGHQWIFRPNGTYGNVHFTPLYFPDGGYTVKVRYSDVWTPGGMITFTRSSNTVKIEGSAYDDWYIGR